MVGTINSWKELQIIKIMDGTPKNCKLNVNNIQQ